MILNQHKEVILKKFNDNFPETGLTKKIALSSVKFVIYKWK